MAIHKDHPGLTVEIMVNGRPLQEYDNNSEEKDPGEVTKYIEARSGVEFEIRYGFVEPFPDRWDLGYQVDIDGKRLADGYYKSGQLLERGHFYTTGVEVETSSGWVLQHFAFADLSATGNSNVYEVSDPPEKGMALGTIKIGLDLGRAGRRKPTSRPLEELSTFVAYSESAFKGQEISHFVSRGAEHRIKAPECDVGWRNRKHIGVFNFKYRSLAALKSLGIVPRTPNPSPVPASSYTPQIPELQHAPEPLAVVLPATPRSKQQFMALPVSIDQDGLSTEELIVIVAAYRGHDKGLASQSRKALLSLLKHYESKDVVPSQEQNNSGDADGHVRIKRERSGSFEVGGRQKKRKEREIIVLDD